MRVKNPRLRGWGRLFRSGIAAARIAAAFAKALYVVVRARRRKLRSRLIPTRKSGSWFPRVQICAPKYSLPRNWAHSRSQKRTRRSRAFFLPTADVDSVMGLLHLREFQSFFVFAAAATQRILKKESKIFGVLDRADPPVQWQVLSSKGRLGCHLLESSRRGAGIRLRYAAPRGSYPDYASEELQRTLSPDDATLGFVFEQKGKSFFMAPSLSGRNSEMDQKPLPPATWS